MRHKITNKRMKTTETKGIEIAIVDDEAKADTGDFHQYVKDGRGDDYHPKKKDKIADIMRGVG